jgi:cytoskeletal protein CcmA (bactofilin family)
VGGDLRAVARDIKLDADVFGDFVAVGSNINVPEGNIIGGNALVAGRNVVIDGVVNGDVVIKAYSVTLNGVVLGDADIEARTLQMGPNASIEGKATLSNSLNADETKFKDGVSFKPVMKNEKSAWAIVAGSVVGFIFLFVVGLIIVLIAPKFSKRVSVAGIKMPVTSFLIGLAVLIGMPILMMILGITIVGIPIALLLLVIYILFILLSFIFGAMSVGELAYIVVDRKATPVMGLLVGCIIFVLVGLLPVIGALFILFFFLVGMGAMTRSFFGKKRAATRKRARRRR